MNPTSQASNRGRSKEDAGHSAGFRRSGRCGAAVVLRNATRGSLLADDVVVANTFLPRLIGLLAETADWSNARRGLWIIPSRGVHTWGMRFPIDVIFLDHQRTVVYIEANLRPWRVSRVVRGARSVIELPASTAANTQTCVGDQIEVFPV